MTKSRSHLTKGGLFAIVLASFSVTPVSGGFFDDLVDKAKQTTQETYEKALDATIGGAEEQTPETSPAPSSSAEPEPVVKPAKPVYDRELVRQIQTKLNAVGINVGAADGIYGGGTRNGIEQFQKRQGLPVDGVPSSPLLGDLEAAAIQASSPQASAITTPESGVSTKLPTDAVEPTLAGIERAALHYAPEALDSEDWLRRAINAMYPKDSEAMQKDEFAWNKRKAEFKQRILAEIQDTPLTFAISPWGNPSSHRWVLGKYDFGQGAFLIRSSKLTFPFGKYDPRPQIAEIQKGTGWLPMDSAAADKLLKSGKLGSTRELYPKYEYRITGVKKYSNKGELGLMPQVSIDEIELYAVKKRGGGYSPGNFEYVTTLKLPSIDKSMSSSKQVEKPAIAAPSGVVLLSGPVLEQALVGKTIVGDPWAAYFGTDGQTETLWKREPKKAAYRIDGNLVCFEEGSEIAVSDCIAVSRTSDGLLTFYELYGKKGKKLIPYRLAPTPFTRAGKVFDGRIASELDPNGHAEVAEADVLGIKLGMTLEEVDSVVQAHRQDMRRVEYDQRAGAAKPWDRGLTHVRYESPDKREVIGVKVEPPAAKNSVTSVWRSLTFDIKKGAPKTEAVIQALFDKYGGEPPANQQKTTAAIYGWVNNGSGLRLNSGCAINSELSRIAEINLYLPEMNPEMKAWKGNKAAVIGPLNHIDENCGESISAFLNSSDGYVEGVTVYLVNQAKLAAIVDQNEKLFTAKTTISAPKF